MGLWETLAVIIIATSIHYITEIVEEMPDYSCPRYCEVDHLHIEDDKEMPRKEWVEKNDRFAEDDSSRGDWGIN